MARRLTASTAQSYAEMLLKPDCFPHEHDERQPADDAQNEQSANSSENTPAPTSESAESANASAPTNAVADLPKLPHRASPSGLAVSGTIRFTPPPNSSPTFDGKPRLIRGYIAVEATCKATARSSSTKRHLQSSTTNEPALSTLTPRKCVKHPVKTFADHQWHTFVHDMSANAQKSTHPIIWRRS